MMNVFDTAALLALLEEDRTFDGLVEEFSAKFEHHTHYNVCSNLVMMLEDSRILKQAQRLVAFYIVHNLYCTEQLYAKPFLSVLIDAATNDSSEKLERSFLLQLLGSSNSNNNTDKKEISSQTAAEYIRTFDPNSHTFLAREQLIKQCLDKLLVEPFKSYMRTTSSKNVIGDPDVAQGCDADASELDDPPPLSKHQISGGDREAAAAREVQNMSLKRLDPPRIRPVPPTVPEQDGLLELLTPVCADTSRGAAVRDLISRGLKEVLAPAQQKEFLMELEADPNLVSDSGFAPSCFPGLVENNPVIAVQVLLMLPDSVLIEDYLKVLLNMDVSPHSMEIVNRLTTAVDLPTQFINNYISNCISSCKNIKDKHMQNRLVRSVCVFLHSLIGNNISDVQDLFIEVEEFCIMFSRIREATGLLRLLRTLE